MEKSLEGAKSPLYTVRNVCVTREREREREREEERGRESP